MELREIIDKIAPLDEKAMDEARKRQEQLAKPPGSLGRLEEMSIQLAGITGKVNNPMDKCRVLVLAADNGVVAQGVSSAPQSVTYSQCINMTRHLTGMSAMANHFGDDVVVTDVGIAVECPAVRNRKIRFGTWDFTKGPAMTREEVLKAIEIGIELVEEAKEDGVTAIGVGEMGIGNTTTSSAILCALTGQSVEAVTGRGGGLTDAAFAKKKQVIETGLALNKPNGEDPIDVLAKVGGFDLAAMTGVYIGCAMYRIPAVVDGFISIVAALCGARLSSKIKNFMFLSHSSFEVGYKVAQAELGLPAMFDLGMRLGEGSGCVPAFRILEAACAVMNEMATFEEAAINDDYLEEIRKGDSF